MPAKAIQLETKKIPKLRFPGFSGEWEEKKLGEVGKFWNGKAHEQDISEHGKYIVVNSKFISQNGEVKKYSDKQISPLKKDDIAIVMSDIPNGKAMGKCFLVNEDNFYTLNQRIGGIKSKEIISSFLIRILNRNKYFLKFDNGVSQTNLRKDEVLRCPVIFPSIPEQQKIAGFLESTDEWIENLRTQKESFESYKKGMMQKIFSQEIRFKDDKGKEFPKWEEKRVEDILEVTRGYVLAVKDMKKISDNKFIYPVYSSQTSNDGLIGYYDKFLYEDAITWTTDGANAGDVNFRKGKFYCTNVCGVLISKKGYANQCIAEILNSISKKYVSYIGNPKLMNNVMSKIKINIPPVLEQQKIAEFLTSIDKIIESKQEQITQAEQWKKGLMQGLFV